MEEATASYWRDAQSLARISELNRLGTLEARLLKYGHLEQRIDPTAWSQARGSGKALPGFSLQGTLLAHQDRKSPTNFALMRKRMTDGMSVEHFPHAAVSVLSSAFTVGSGFGRRWLTWAIRIVCIDGDSAHHR